MLNDPYSPQSHLEVRFDLIEPDWITHVAHILHTGSLKYGDDNWKQLPLADHLNHAMAHIQAYRMGDVSEDHLINVVCRMMFAYYCDKQLLSKTVQPVQQEVYNGPDKPDAIADH